MTRSYHDQGKNHRIHFRNLCLDDLAHLHRWLNLDFVSCWYGKRTYTYLEIKEKYEPRIKGETPVDPYLILCDDIPIGYIQAYKISALPDYNRYIQADEHTVGIDMLIGERTYLHKGFGSAALRNFVTHIIFQHADVDQCIIGPDPKNKAAIRAYHKAGFQYLKTIQIPDQDESEYLMRIDREMLAQTG